MDQVESLISSDEVKEVMNAENIPLADFVDGDNYEKPTPILETFEGEESVTRTGGKLLNSQKLSSVLSFGNSATNKERGHRKEEETQDQRISRLMAENEQLQRTLKEMNHELQRNRRSGNSSCEAIQEGINVKTTYQTTDADEKVSSWQRAKAWIGRKGRAEGKYDGEILRNNVVASTEQVNEQVLKRRRPMLLENIKSLPKSKPDIDRSVHQISTKSKNSDHSCSDTELFNDDEEVGCLTVGNDGETRSNNEEDGQSLPDTEDTNSEGSFVASLVDRSSWLVGLLILQSLSGFILENNQKLLRDHHIIVNFLTMLVGAGGNAGNQASVRVIRGLAVGTLNSETQGNFLRTEAKMAVCVGSILGITGFVRAAIFSTPRAETIAITTSLIAIVVISIGLGSTLPLAMRKVRIDPAHSSTTIQVIMDILGVSITCWVCTLILKPLLTKESLEMSGNDDIL